MTRKQIIYQAAPRTFSKEGTINAITEKIPYLKNLGIDIIYLCPVFLEDDDPDRKTWSPRQIASGAENPKNPYKMKDYYNVDDEFGTNDDLKSLIDTAHKHSLKVILDLVFLHCGRNAVFAKEHPDWLVCDENGKPIVGEEWPFARINYNSAGVREYLWNNMEYYIRDYKADGFRCDVGDMVPLDFWIEGVRRIKCINPDIIMLNEGTNRQYIESGAFDMDYLSFFGEKLGDLLKENTVTDRFKSLADYLDGLGGTNIMLIENHDSASNSGDNRFDKKYGFDITNQCMFLIYALPGVPFIWNGNEFADTACVSMFTNRFSKKHEYMDIGTLETENGRERYELLKQLNAFYHSDKSDEIVFGKTKILSKDGDSVLVFAREYNGKTTFAALNLTDEKQEKSAKVSEVLIARKAKAQGNTIILEGRGFILFK